MSDRLYYISDIHLELLDSINIEPLKPLYNKNRKGSYLALLGDICNPFHKNLSLFFDKISPIYNKIFYICGNHEYYNLVRHFDITKDMFLEKVYDICDSFPNVILLNDSTYDLHGIKLIGTTLWTPGTIYEILNNLADYVMIKVDLKNRGCRMITPFDVDEWNEDAIEFITSELKTTQPCIVLTHHAPLNSYITDPKYNMNNNVVPIIKYPMVAWLYGHTHEQYHSRHNNVIMETNQLGYFNEDVHFDPSKYLDIGQYISF
jgi:predicted phosphodiesterase